VSPCQEEREAVKLADIVRTSSPPSASASAQVSVINSTDLLTTIESSRQELSPRKTAIAAVWDRRVCGAKEVETQSRYTLSERSALVADRLKAAMSGSVPPPYLYDHNNDRL
jgi:hypothetical protein